jgi:hypothetical protein
MKEILIRLPIRSDAFLNCHVIAPLSFRHELIEEYLPRQWFATPAGPNAPDSSVEILLESAKEFSLPGELRASEAIIEVFPGNNYFRVKDGRSLFLLHETRCHSIHSIFDSAGSAIPNRIELKYLEPDAPKVESLVLRIIRDLLQNRLHEANHFILHAACLCRNGATVALVGDKGAGKSAWMLRLLSQGWGLIANDRVFVSYENMTAIGYPIAAMINPASLQNLPATLKRKLEEGRIIRHDHKTPGYKKIGFTPMELCLSANVPHLENERLTHIIILNSRGDSHSLRQISSTAIVSETLQATFSRNIYYPNDPTYAFDWCTHPAKKRFTSEALTQRLTKAAFCFQLDFNWKDFDGDPTYEMRLP